MADKVIIDCSTKEVKVVPETAEQASARSALASVPAATVAEKLAKTVGITLAELKAELAK